METTTEEKTSFIDKLLSSKKTILLIILLIFLLGLGVRSHLLKYDYMFEFDTYWHLRATEYTLKGELPAGDPLGYYYHRGPNDQIYNNRPQFLWYFTAFLYTIFTFGAAFNKALLMNFARVLPAVFGGIIAVLMFFLGKELYNKKVGLVMGIVAATIPAFVYRTMAGFFEEDSFGFLWFVAGLIFLVRATKNMHATKKHLTQTLIACLFFSLMIITWRAYLLIPLVIGFYFVINIFFMAYKNATKFEIGSFVKIMVVVAIIFMSVASLAYGNVWTRTFKSYASRYVPYSQENIDRVMGRPQQDDSNKAVVTIGEENKGWPYFYSKYSLLTFLPFLALLLMPIYLFWPKLFGFKKNHEDYRTLLLFSWIVVCLYLAYTKLKFTFYLGLPIAAATGFLAYLYFNWVKEKSINIKRIGAVVLAIFLLTSIAAGVHHVEIHKPQINTNLGWLEAFDWINENTSEDAKIFNWWDHGHWITYFTERRASTDNTNYSKEANQDFATFILTTDLNKSVEIIKKYDADYIMVENDMFGKYRAYALYKYQATSFTDPRVTKYVGLASRCYEQRTPVSQQVSYMCSIGNLEKTQMENTPTTWQKKPAQLVDNIPTHLYRDKNNNYYYFLNPAINSSTMAKMWFYEENASNYFTEVFHNETVKVFKVNKENIN
jgi:asparagine N-glycosylation enzyme membrane subunit Stt3